MQFEDFFTLISHHTLIDKERGLTLWKLLNYINMSNIKGDVVECGCYKGGSSAILRASMGQNRRLWIYDSFQGMPETSERDGIEASKYIGACKASVDDVLNILKLTGAKENEYFIIEGWFHETLKKRLPREVGLLHIDADWYESVMIVLETFYPRIAIGGCVILDDFGYWEGCREAFYEFCFKHHERPLLERVGTSQAYWIKGRTNNRGGLIF